MNEKEARKRLNELQGAVSKFLSAEDGKEDFDALVVALLKSAGPTESRCNYFNELHVWD